MSLGSFRFGHVVGPVLPNSNEPAQRWKHETRSDDRHLYQAMLIMDLCGDLTRMKDQRGDFWVSLGDPFFAARPDSDLCFLWPFQSCYSCH